MSNTSFALVILACAFLQVALFTGVNPALGSALGSAVLFA